MMRVLAMMSAIAGAPVLAVAVLAACGWASVPENSFLATHEETRRDLAAAGFEIASYREMPADASAELRRKLETEGLPPLGPHTVRQGDGLQMLINSMRAREDGRAAEVQIVARKPG